MSELFVLGYRGTGFGCRAFAVARAGPARLIISPGAAGRALSYRAFRAGGQLLDLRDLGGLIVHAAGFPAPRTVATHTAHWVWSNSAAAVAPPAEFPLPMGMRLVSRARTVPGVCVAFAPGRETGRREIHLAEPIDQFPGLHALFDLLSESTGTGPPRADSVLARVLTQGFGVPPDDSNYTSTAADLADNFRTGIRALLTGEPKPDRVRVEAGGGGEWIWEFTGRHAGNGTKLSFRPPARTAAVTGPSRDALRAALVPGAAVQIVTLAPQSGSAPWNCGPPRRADEFLFDHIRGEGP